MTQKIWRSPLGKGIDPLLPIIGRGAGKHRVQLLLQLALLLLELLQHLLHLFGGHLAALLLAGWLALLNELV